MTAYHADNKNTITETRSNRKVKTDIEIYFRINGGSDGFLFERMIQTATDGLQKHYSKVLVKMLKQKRSCCSRFHNQYEFRN
ncbi:MAG: hypothetical protein M3156_02890 [Thermoproteota archaeon]|nr:hypothetical protein [Thermoproteota archaeon]